MQAFREHNDVAFNGVAVPDDFPVPDDVAQAWSVAHTDPTKRAGNERALDGGPGGVAPHTYAFKLDQPRAEVRTRLHLQGDLELHWLGPPDASAPPVEQRGDGEVLSQETRLPAIGVIPFTLTLRRTGALALSASKAEPAAPTLVKGEGKLLQGEEYVLQTEHTLRWAPQAIAFVLGSAKDLSLIHI